MRDRPSSLALTMGLAIAAAILASGDLAQAQADGYVVIVNEANTTATLSASQASRFFLKKTTKWAHGATVKPVDLSARSAVRAKFSQGVHKRSVSAVKAYWQKQIFTGRGVPPPEKRTESAAVSYVRTHVGAIGYVSASAQLSGVKTLTITR